MFMYNTNGLDVYV